jgi:hypothetical protein
LGALRQSRQGSPKVAIVPGRLRDVKAVDLANRKKIRQLPSKASLNVGWVH